ncbi:YkvA family protein [Christiangramia sp. SM2212]|uniref:YkvA family protein n=1 Tax=Christiangramia sediminicola TaxID=3073267 RepID=A0ABU1ETS0_9FLAO|nr:YkvA family protein [Christiangramia sp. SM2212]MDR5591795.1 YkvA family protein [Christiangramia sp. SM2212]
MFGKKKKINEDLVKTEVAKIDEDDVTIAMDSQEEVDAKINNSGLLQKYSELAKVMYGMLKDYRRGVYNKVPWFTIATIAFSFLYILNPLDIIPDFVPGLGYIDDMAIITFGLRFIQSDIHNYLDWKLEHGDTSGTL